MTYVVVLADAPDATVVAASVEHGGGQLTFRDAAGKVVAQFPMSDVVGFRTQHPVPAHWPSGVRATGREG